MAKTITVDLKVKDDGSVVIEGFSNKTKQEFTEIETKSKQTTDSITKHWKAFLGLFATAQVAQFLKNVAVDAINTADAISKLSTRTGAAVEDLDKLRQIAELSDVSFGELSSAIQFMQRNLVEAQSGTGTAAEALKSLGINVKDIINLRPEEQFRILGKAIAGVEGDAKKVAVAMELMGRGGAAVLQMLPDLNNNWDKFSSNLSPEKAQAAADFNDEITKIKETFKQMAMDLLPSVNKGLEFFRENITAITTAVGLLVASQLVSFLLNIATNAWAAAKALQAVAVGTTAAAAAAQRGVVYTTALSGAFNFLIPIIRTAITVFATLGAFLVSPTGLVIAGFIALQVLLMKQEGTWDTLINKVGKYIDEAIRAKKAFESGEGLNISPELDAKLRGQTLTGIKPGFSGDPKDKSYPPWKMPTPQYRESESLRGWYWYSDQTKRDQQKLQDDINKKALETQKKFQEEKLQALKTWSEMNTKMYGTAYDIELAKIKEVLAELEKKGAITKSQGGEYLAQWQKDYFKADTYGYGEGLSEAMLADEKAWEEWKVRRKSVLEQEKQFQNEMDSITADMSNNRKLAYQTDLAELLIWAEAQKKEFPELIALIDKVVEKKKEMLSQKHGSDLQKWVESVKTADEMIESIAINTSERFASGISDAFVSFVDGTKSAKEAFTDFAKTFLSEIAKMITQMIILNAIKQAGKAMGFGFADGGIIPGGTGVPFKAFASGGVVSSPTYALMGEGKYNEAVVPLPDGRSIPVQMKGNTGNNFNINVNVDGSKGGTPQENERLGRTIARQVKEQVKEILTDERRFGGINGRNSMARAY